MSNVRCLPALRAQKVSINVRAMHERHLHKAALSRRGGTKVHITKSEISMRAWRSPMSAASQGAFVDIPEISLCDISCIKKAAGNADGS